MSTFYGFIRRWFYGFRSFLFRVFQVVGNALLSGIVLALIIGGTTYAMTGTKMLPNFLSSGVDFISFFSDTGTGNAGVDAKSFYARSNGSWIGYPADNYNYLRNHTFLSGTLIDENNNNYYVNPDGTTNLNQLCINGVCKNTWPSTSPIASYAASHSGTYSCTISTNTFYAVVTGTTLRAYVMKGYVSTVPKCDTGIQTMDNYTTSVACKNDFEYIGVKVGCSEGWNGVGCTLIGELYNADVPSSIPSSTCTLHI